MRQSANGCSRPTGTLSHLSRAAARTAAAAAAAAATACGGCDCLQRLRQRLRQRQLLLYAAAAEAGGKTFESDSSRTFLFSRGVAPGTYAVCPSVQRQQLVGCLNARMQHEGDNEVILGSPHTGGKIVAISHPRASVTLRRRAWGAGYCCASPPHISCELSMRGVTHREVSHGEAITQRSSSTSTT